VPALTGGKPAQGRELRAQGQRTVRRLLEAALAEFDEHGFQAVRVDDIVRRAQISHGTFYLYFASKEDLFKVLVQGALHEMAIVADEFPVVTRNAAGRAALLSWVHSFCRIYEAHATVLWIITRPQVDDADIYSPGLQLFFRLSEIMVERMTAAAERDNAVAAAPPEGENGEGATCGHAELTGLLCLLMLEGVNTLLNAEVQLPRDGMAERISDIIYAAFSIP
jgi:AcrR family transcriptional regulator